MGLREGERVLAHDETDLGGVESGEIVDEAHRIGETFGVRVVGAEDDAVGAEVVAQLDERILVVRRHPHVRAQLLDRVAARELGRPLRVALLQPPHETGNPVGAALDRRDPQIRMTGEHAVADQRADRVEDRAVTTGERAERVVTEGLHLVGCTPVGGVARVAGVAGVVRDEDPGLVEPGPERVVDRVAR